MENPENEVIDKDVESLKVDYKRLLWEYTFEKNKAYRNCIQKKIRRVKRLLNEKTGNPIYR